jgi:hypothetical protein
MTDKIRITADRVVSRGKGKIKFYNDAGAITTESSKLVQVFETEAELQIAVEDSRRNFEAEEDATVKAEASEGGDQVPNDEQPATDAPAAASGSSKSSRSKGKGKEQMASKKKAGKKAARKTSNGATIRSVAGREHDVSNYEKVKNASGHTSLDCGDDIAQTLRGKTLDEVYATAAKKLKEPEKDLRAKYKHLNAGMQRMSLGNRLRKVLNDKAAA